MTDRITSSRPVIVLVLLIAVGLGGAPALAAGSAEEAVRAYVSAYRSADTDAMVSVYADDATFIDVSQQKEVHGKDDLRQMLAALTIVHTAMDVEVKRELTEGKTAVLEVVYTGTIDPSMIGRTDLGPQRYEIPAVLIFETNKGLIERQIDYLDFRALSELMAKIQPPNAG